MSIPTRISAALELAGTRAELTPLLARTLARYGSTDVTWEAGGRYDVLTGYLPDPALIPVRLELLAAPRSHAITDRRRAWLDGDPVAPGGDNFEEAVELATDIICALAWLGADHHAVVGKVEDDFLSPDED